MDKPSLFEGGPISDLLEQKYPNPAGIIVNKAAKYWAQDHGKRKQRRY